MSTKAHCAGDGSWAGVIAIVGFVFVATAQVTNTILARTQIFGDHLRVGRDHALENDVASIALTADPSTG
jgi:hypothetical protein